MHKLELETIASCNRTCGTCQRQTYSTVPGSNDDKFHTARFENYDNGRVASRIGVGIKMPTETFEKIIEQAKDISDLKVIVFSHYSEPFLDDRLPEFLQYIKKEIPHIHLQVCTNFDFMSDELASKVDGVVDRFNVSLYYEDPVYSERKKLIKSWFSTSVLNIHPAGKAEDYHMTTHFSPRTERLEEKIKGYQDRPCTRYNGMCIIDYLGNFKHCCEDYSGEFNLGNINDMTIMEMWESEVHQKLMKDLSFRGGRRLYKHCIDCPDKG